MSDIAEENAVLELEDLCYSYENGQELFGGLRVHIAAGSTTHLMGPNGAGKSTLLGLFAGTVDAVRASYRLTWRGRPAPLADLCGDVAYASARPMLFEDLSGAENVELMAQLFGESQSYRDRVMELCTEGGLAPALDRSVRLYSSGMRQKLWLFAILGRRLDLVLLDEPFSNLDPEGVELVCREVNHAPGATVISSHQPVPGVVIDAELVLGAPQERIGAPDAIVSSASA